MPFRDNQFLKISLLFVVVIFILFRVMHNKNMKYEILKIET